MTAMVEAYKHFGLDEEVLPEALQKDDALNVSADLRGLASFLAVSKGSAACSSTHQDFRDRALLIFAEAAKNLDAGDLVAARNALDLVEGIYAPLLAPPSAYAGPAKVYGWRFLGLGRRKLEIDTQRLRYNDMGNLLHNSGFPVKAAQMPDLKNTGQLE